MFLLINALRMRHLPLIIFATYVSIVGCDNFMGCYYDSFGAKMLVIDRFVSQPKLCIDLCHNKYYRYVLIRETGNCICANYLGDMKSSERCADYCHDCEEMKPFMADVYYTGITVSAPPRNLTVSNISGHSASLDWIEPESFQSIAQYTVTIQPLDTYSTTVLPSLELQYTNDTLHVELASLNPATRYNVSVRAMPVTDQGAAPISQLFQTLLEDPDNAPERPQIIKRDDKEMTVRLKPVINNNGPISSYVIVVINSGSIQTIELDNLKSYNEAMNDGLTYYLTAEIKPERISSDFVIGDEGIYGRYFNAPLESDTNYRIMLGIVSQVGNDRRIVYSPTTLDDIIIPLQFPDERENYSGGVRLQDGDQDGERTLIVALSVGIGLLSCLLILCIAGFLVLRNRVQNRHRRRLNNVQELSIQGPMIDVANGGYIPEDESGSTPNHYDQLKERVWVIPQTSLDVQHNITLGAGQFGRVYQGTVTKRDLKVNQNAPGASNVGQPSPTTVAVYVIHDKRLSTDSKRAMLRAVDLSIRAQRHEHILSLIGTTEFADNIAVVLEYAPISLKEWLLNSRVTDGVSFSTLTEAQALSFASDIASGMTHLSQRCRIVHKELCAVHVHIATNNDGPNARLLAKVGGLGAARYYRAEFAPHPVRWQALEVLRGARESHKSDVWAYACVLWEICSLGGTPYGNTSASEVPTRVLAGLRLPQLRYVHDTLYQVMLNCWQIDPDERPTFAELHDAIESLRSDTFMSHIVFDMHEPRFDYEQYYPEMESTAYPIM